MKKNSIIFIVIIVIVVAIGGYFAYQKCLSPTAGWKTYFDSKYNFELRVPRNLQSEVSDQGGNLYDVNFWEDNSSDSRIQLGLEINTNDWVKTTKNSCAENKDYFTNLFADGPRFESAKTILFKEEKTKYNQTVCLLETEIITTDGSKNNMAVSYWFDNGKLFSLTDGSFVNGHIQLIKDISLSFIDKSNK